MTERRTTTMTNTNPAARPLQPGDIVRYRKVGTARLVERKMDDCSPRDAGEGYWTVQWIKAPKSYRETKNHESGRRFWFVVADRLETIELAPEPVGDETPAAGHHVPVEDAAEMAASLGMGDAAELAPRIAARRSRPQVPAVKGIQRDQHGDMWFVL
jgi:hypothetical protein